MKLHILLLALLIGLLPAHCTLSQTDKNPVGDRYLEVEVISFNEKGIQVKAGGAPQELVPMELITAYRLKNGKIELKLRGGGILRTSLGAQGYKGALPADGQWKLMPARSQGKRSHLRKAASPSVKGALRPAKSQGKKSHLRKAASPSVEQYKDFGREVAQVISKMKEVAVGNRELSDLRMLEFLLRDYKQAVAARNWKKADLIKERMRVALSRGGAVAAEAEKRKADRARKIAERRHRETMRQKERQHREAMQKQQELIDRINRRW